MKHKIKAKIYDEDNRCIFKVRGETKKVFDEIDIFKEYKE